MASIEEPSRDRFLQAASGKTTDRPPVWMMRQAGRYLPEYQKIRDEYSFKEAISTPDIAVEISLQPWERFRPDGIVMYSDILPALELLDISYHLEAGVGPVIENPISSPDAIPGGAQREPESHLSHVGELLGRLSNYLEEKAAVIGFVGGPFTLAAYATQGEPSRNFMAIRRLRYQHPAAFETLLKTIGSVVKSYAEYQIEAGADVIQLFDTYAGLLPRADIESTLVPIYQEILRDLTVPTIVFARHTGQLLDLFTRSGADVISIDWTVDLRSARDTIGDNALQGNLDPAALYGSPEHIAQQTTEIIEAGECTGHILNLGHGVDRSTPIKGVETFFETAQTYPN